MSQLNRPIAETVLMMIKFICNTPPHTGAIFNVFADILRVPSEKDSTIQEIPVTVFRAGHINNNKEVILQEPNFSDINYIGVTVQFVISGVVIDQRNYKGTDIADIGTHIFEFLAAS